MSNHTIVKTLAALTLVATAGIAQAAAPVYVGSWTVDQGPSWTTNPLSYTGQEAAALLFGGSASDYFISTVDNTVANINHSAWISTWGGACGGTFPCGTVVAENFEVSTGGSYLNSGDTSAYVQDWAVGPDYTNYAFRVAAVPEPETYAMMLAGLGVLGFMGKRRKTQ